MELLCIDFLTLERSKGGYEKILVMTDHFSKFAQAIPTKNELATTVAKALVDKFIVHYGIPRRLHSDQGRNFLSDVIKQLCRLLGMKQAAQLLSSGRLCGGCRVYSTCWVQCRIQTRPTGRTMSTLWFGHTTAQNMNQRDTRHIS